MCVQSIKQAARSPSYTFLYLSPCVVSAGLACVVYSTHIMVHNIYMYTSNHHVRVSQHGATPTQVVLLGVTRCPWRDTPKGCVWLVLIEAAVSACG